MIALWLIVGLFVGAFVGYVIGAFCAARSTEDLLIENCALRTALQNLINACGLYQDDVSLRFFKERAQEILKERNWRWN